MHDFIIALSQIDQVSSSDVGGKAAGLSVLFKYLDHEGYRDKKIMIPEGFVILTSAFSEVMATPEAAALLEQLESLTLRDKTELREIGGRLQNIIETAEISAELHDRIAEKLSEWEPDTACAVRSSATAEDLPTDSFAGQHDTFLNVLGEEGIVKAIKKCWASLFSERAIHYRIENGIGHGMCHIMDYGRGHKSVQMAVIVQKMVFPNASGVLFTADPLTGNRKVSVIEAVFGLGEGLVSGKVNPDVYKIKDGLCFQQVVSRKEQQVVPNRFGGVAALELPVGLQNSKVLTDEQIALLEQFGRNAEAFFGAPQDMEWGMTEEGLYLLQCRPITTLYPVPEGANPGNRVFVSVGHQQMMTDPMRPLGMSVFRMTSVGPRYEAGGRLFVDVTENLISPDGRKYLLDVLGKSDPLIREALKAIVTREDFIKIVSEDKAGTGTSHGSGDFQIEPEQVPERLAGLIQKSEEAIEKLKWEIQDYSGTALIDFIMDDIQRLKQSLFDPQNISAILGAMNAFSWINENMFDWLGEKNAADVLTQSVSGNITSEMGFELMDVADVVRDYPEVIAYLEAAQETGKAEGFPEILSERSGGTLAMKAILTYLDKYGMRCEGEIDITRLRWSESPAALIPLLIGNLKNFEKGEHQRKFESGRQVALEKAESLIRRVRRLKDGAQKADETARRIEVLRSMIGYREYPKYSIVSRYAVYKKALLREADALFEAGVIPNRESIFYLTLEELRTVVESKKFDWREISGRREAHRRYEKMMPPRVITSEGECISGHYGNRDLPKGALVGLPVSAGVAEGRARIMKSMTDAVLESDDILVTTFTDPSWTPIFLSAKAVITEVGGLMTHGAVIAREYGIPAVVGVENATVRIKEGQRIRVNGTEGVIEIL